MSGLAKCMRLVLEMLIYEMLIKNSGISQIYGGKNCRGNNNKSWVAISIFFIISSPLPKLEGILSKLTMFIEYFSFLERWCCSQKWTTGRTQRWVNDNEPRLWNMLYHGLTPWIFNPLQCSINSAVTFLDLTEWRCGICRKRKSRFTVTSDKRPRVYKVDQTLYFKQQFWGGSGVSAHWRHVAEGFFTFQREPWACGPSSLLDHKVTSARATHIVSFSSG